MTTENQTVISIQPTTTHSSHIELVNKSKSILEERKGNAVKPLSLRPNRSVKKNTSLKPLGLRSK